MNKNIPEQYIIFLGCLSTATSLFNAVYRELINSDFIDFLSDKNIDLSPLYHENLIQDKKIADLIEMIMEKKHAGN